MAETLPDMLERISAFQHDSVPDEITFGLAPAVLAKVMEQSGKYLPFYGNSVIYYLDDDALALCDQALDFLDQRLGGWLSQRLQPDSMHITLTDLRASADLTQVAAQVFLDDPIFSNLLRSIPRSAAIELRITAVFNLMNTSIAVGVAPATAADYERLMAARRLFELPASEMPYTPHITLAYYRPNPKVAINPVELRDALAELTEMLRGKRIMLHRDLLQYVHFSSMASYWKSG